MLAFRKLLQSIAATLHSEGTPTQIVLGIALGAALGLTQLDAVKQQLDAELESLTGGLIGLPKLPGT